ncbi:hypothetical protein [Streptomyces sp. H39-S7]|uniref:hypothetical protein n=1 Tax=Streptomyces sp. H39-S7 TaxID=3004357 RepID=UPI0022B03291|nr:hypothetical protein [Streptomyces sp. H39-S7]MCZ4124169.1 hypothetical protein [Streptomyces sp. H39-S7]
MAPGSRRLSDLDARSQLRSLAERIHQAAQDMPFTNARHYVSDNLDELEDRIRDIAELIMHVTSSAAFANRGISSPADPKDCITQRRVTALTQAVGTVGCVVADLGTAVAHAGLLQHAAPLAGLPELARAGHVTHSALDQLLNNARDHLYQAAHQLRLDADHLTPTALPPCRAPTPAAVQAVSPSSPRRR